MNKQTYFLTIVTFLLLTLIFSSIVFAQFEVGVKKGDWIEYEQSLTQFNSESSGKIKIEIVSVQGNYVVLRQSALDENNHEQVDTIEGEVGQDFLEGWIIPSNLGVGDSFNEDGSYLNDKFEITLSGIKNVLCCGDSRDVVYSSNSQMEGMTSYWDVETGMLLEGIRQTDSADYHIKVVDSNLWENVSESSDDNLLIYGVGAVVVIAVALGIVFFKFKK